MLKFLITFVLIVTAGPLLLSLVVPLAAAVSVIYHVTMATLLCRSGSV